MRRKMRWGPGNPLWEWKNKKKSRSKSKVVNMTRRKSRSGGRFRGNSLFGLSTRGVIALGLGTAGAVGVGLFADRISGMIQQYTGFAVPPLVTAFLLGGPAGAAVSVGKGFLGGMSSSGQSSGQISSGMSSIYPNLI